MRRPLSARTRRIAIAAAVLLFVLVVTSSALGYYQTERERWLKTAPVSVLAASVKRHPEDREVAFRLAHRYTVLGRHPEAVTLLNHLVEREPRNHAYWFGLARAASASGQSVRSEEAYLRALQLSPRDGVAFSSLGGMYTAAGLDREALRLYQESARYVKPPDGVVFTWATSLHRLGRSQEAWDMVYASLKGHPAQDDPYILLGALAEKLGRRSDAEPLLRKRMELMRVYVVGLARAPLARLIADQPASPAELQKAEELARQAVTDLQPRPEFDAALATVLIARGRLQEARQALETGLKRNPSHEECLRMLVGVLERQGRTAEAQRARERLPEYVRRQAEFERLHQAAKQAQSAEPSIRLAVALANAGATARASEVCTEALERFPGDATLEARRREYHSAAIRLLQKERVGPMRNADLSPWSEE